MELPSQSGLISPNSTMESSGEDDTPSRQQVRKSNKPLLEKKRRARINRSLEDLKALVLEALKKDSARYSKLEKADILEMTVKHLREVQRSQMSAAMTVDPNVISKFHNGFEECAQEVHRYLGTIDGLSPEVRIRLMQHLSNCLNQSNPRNSMPYPAGPMYGGLPCASSPQSLPGMNMRCSLPFGGLAFGGSSPESPTLPVTPNSYYNPNDYRRVDVSVTPHGYTSTPRTTSRDMMSRKRENTENIAPSWAMRPLGEKHDNRSIDLGDRNNNVCVPMPKRLKVEDNSQYISGLHHQQVDLIQHHLLEVDVKGEPVWRPW